MCDARHFICSFDDKNGGFLSEIAVFCCLYSFLQSHSKATVDDEDGDTGRNCHKKVIRGFGGYAVQEGSVLAAETAEFQGERHRFAAAERPKHQRADDGHVAMHFFEKVSFQSESPAGLRFGNRAIFFEEIRDKPKSRGEHERIFIGHMHLAHHRRREILETRRAEKINEEKRHVHHAKRRDFTHFERAAAQIFDGAQHHGKNAQRQYRFNILIQKPRRDENQQFDAHEDGQGIGTMEHERPESTAHRQNDFRNRYQFPHHFPIAAFLYILQNVSISLQ